MRDITIAKNISELRKAKGVTQEQLANSLGVSFQAVSKWENGTLPSVEQLSELANLLHISVDEI